MSNIIREVSNHKPNFKKKKSIIKWLQLILSERFGLDITLDDSNDDNISLFIDDPNHGLIQLPKTSSIFLSPGNKDVPCGYWNARKEGWFSILDDCIPAPGANTLTYPLIKQKGNGYRINYDILGLVYWMLSRQEEVDSVELDDFGRFPATASHAYRYKYLDRPIVDEWLHILGEVIQRQWVNIQLTKHQFSIIPSHDVDSPSHYGFKQPKALVKTVAIDVLKRNNYKSILVGPWIRLRTKNHLYPHDPHNTFDWIMDESERQGLKSAFYFICGRTDESKDSDYEVEHPAIRNLMKKIYNRGHEIGLHPSYATYQSQDLIVKEANRLKKVCAQEQIKQSTWGGRMHFLRWDQPVTLYGWEAATMTYDSTLSYADRPGFRCGSCYEYNAFDPVKGKALNLRIRPLIVMECTIIAERFLGLGYTNHSLETFLDLKEKCRMVGGNFTLLWHNSHFNNMKDKEFYKAIIK